MKDNVVNVLLKVGVPASVKGFTYIRDAMELFEEDPYYSDGKICALYAAVAKKRNATSYGVERAIRHAFECAVTRGNREMVEKYLDLDNTQNSNLLRTLHLRLKQEMQEKKKNRQIISSDRALSTPACGAGSWEMEQQIYVEMERLLASMLEAMLMQLRQSGDGRLLKELSGVRPVWRAGA